MAPCCLKARPPFQPIRYLGEFYLVFVLCGTDCILVPWIALPFTQSTLSVSLTSSQPLMSSLGRGLFSRSACTFRDWEERAFIMHCSSLHLKTHLKMPEHLVSTFVYAVDLIFDLSYLIKCFLKRCFSLFQWILLHSWKCLVMIVFEAKGESINIIERFKLSDLGSCNAFWWVKFHVRA